MEYCKNCKKIDNIDIELVLIEWGDPVIGDMGDQVMPSYYECPKCKWQYFNPEPSANLLAQTIDKKILDRIIKDFKQEIKS